MDNMNMREKISAYVKDAAGEGTIRLLQERDRGFASDVESWGELKRSIERTAEAGKSGEKLLKSMWESIDDEASYRVYLEEMERSARKNAEEWLAVCVTARLAMDYTEGA